MRGKKCYCGHPYEAHDCGKCKLCWCKEYQDYHIKFASKQQEEFFMKCELCEHDKSEHYDGVFCLEKDCICRSGEMADTSDLKSDGVAPHESSSLSSGNTNEALIELRRAHEALLTTLAASTHSWIHKVHKNAKAYYMTLKEKYKWK